MVSAVVTPLAEAMMSKMVSADHQGIKYNINVTIKYTTSTYKFKIIKYYISDIIVNLIC